VGKALDYSSAPVGTPPSLMARLVAIDGSGAPIAGEGNQLLPADVTAITRRVYDMTTGLLVSQVALTVSSVLAATLTADAAWQSKPFADSTGRNFLDRPPGSNFQVANHVYKVLYTLTTTGGTELDWEYEHTTTSGPPTG
jgi:hypothetical protein